MAEIFLLTDDEFGDIAVRINTRARHLIMKIQPDGSIFVTVPPGVREKSIRDFISNYRTAIRRKRQLCKTSPDIDWNYVIEAPHFHFSLAEGGKAGFQLRTQGREVTLLCPPETDFCREGMQTWLHNVVREALRERAKNVLPRRIALLSERTGLSYHSVKINASKGRWGSCSTRKDVNLSCSLMLLPEHLIDYVILHELCHTVEMNHSERFWRLLDEYTGQRSRELRAELRQYNTY